MPVELKVQEKSPESFELTIKNKDVKKINLSVRRTLDGNLMIQDHHSMHIVVMPDKGKIISMPKGEYNSDCYADQDDLFKFLSLNGVVKVDSINGNNLYGSLEGSYNTDKKGEEEPVEVVMLNIHNFLKGAKERHQVHKQYIDDLERNLLDPDDESTTELGEIPHEEFKGSIPKWGFLSKGIYRYNY